MKIYSVIFLAVSFIYISVSCTKEPPKSPVQEQVVVIPEDNSYEKAVKRMETILKEIEPYFADAEDAEGNGAALFAKLFYIGQFRKISDRFEELYPQKELWKKEILKLLKVEPEWISTIESFTGYNRFRFKRDLAEGPNLQFPELDDIRTLFLVNRELLGMFAQNKELDKYLKVLKGSIHFIKTFDEPSLPSHRTLTDCSFMLLKGVNDSLPYIQNPEFVQNIIDMLPDPDLLSDRFTMAVKGEIAIYGPFIRKLDAKAFTNILKILKIGLKMKIRLTKRIEEEGKAYLDFEKKTYFEKMLELLEISKQPYREVSVKAIELCTTKVFDGNIISYSMMPACDNSFSEQPRALSRRTIVEAVLRTHLFYLKNNKLPESLDEISAYYDKGGPRDSYTGSFLIYHKDEDPLYFRIKDIGADQTDSGTLLRPLKNPDTGTFNHAEFGWRQELMEHVFGVDYY